MTSAKGTVDLPESVRALRTVPGGLRSPVNRSLLDYWRQLQASTGGDVPHRRSVDPIDIGAALLPYVFLCEFVADGGVLIRLQGSQLTEQTGLNLTGRLIDESSFGVNAPAIRDLYHAVRLARRPIATRETVLTSVYKTILSEVLHLPLLGEAGDVVFVLGSLDRLDQAYLPNDGFHAAEWATIQLVASL